MCGGTTHPRMTKAPKLTLGAMTSAVTTAELSTMLMFRRIPFPSTYYCCQERMSTLEPETWTLAFTVPSSAVATMSYIGKAEVDPEPLAPPQAVLSPSQVLTSLIRPSISLK